MRREKVRSVHENLRTRMRFDVDQGEVWDNISALSADAGVHLPTGAMKDVLESREDVLSAYVEAVKLTTRMVFDRPQLIVRACGDR